MSNEYYDEKYWEYQSEIGKIGGVLNKFKFEDYITPTDTVLDFGCGGGFLLDSLKASRKIGFEINKSAAQHARTLGIEIYDDFENMSDESVDTIISNHALEHVPDPITSLKQLFRILKQGGRIVVVLPCEQPTDQEFLYKKDDINQHLYTWCPQSFGNLLNFVGFNVESCQPLRHTWTPDYKTAYADENYHQRCIEYAQKRGTYQIHAVAKK